MSEIDRYVLAKRTSMVNTCKGLDIHGRPMVDRVQSRTSLHHYLDLALDSCQRKSLPQNSGMLDRPNGKADGRCLVIEPVTVPVSTPVCHKCLE